MREESRDGMGWDGMEWNGMGWDGLVGATLRVLALEQSMKTEEAREAAKLNRRPFAVHTVLSTASPRS
jgi:hypothetical protein